MKTRQKQAKQSPKKHISLVLPAKRPPLGPVVTIPEPPAPVETVATIVPTLEVSGTQDNESDGTSKVPGGTLTERLTPRAPAREKKTPHPAVAEIAAQLGETKTWPLKQIKAIVWALGATQARDLAVRAQEIHNGEGMLVKSGQRKRTAGGIFFALCYSEGKPKEGRTLVKPVWQPKRKKKIAVQAEAPAGQS